MPIALVGPVMTGLSPETSRSVVATGYGGPENLSVVQEAVGPPGHGDVLVEVRAIGVNPIDYKMYSGATSADPSALPIRLGFELAGVVTAVGEDATGPAGAVSVGDEVIAYRVTGAYAERVVVPASAIVPKPANLSWEQAAGLLLAGATAVHAVTAAGIGAGDTVLVHAAAGGVGLLAVQIATARGAHIIGTASPRNHELLRSYGVVPVAYGNGLTDLVRQLAPGGVDAALDLVGSDEAVDASLDLVADRRRIVSIAGFARASDGIALIGGGPGADPGTELRDAARLDLVRWAGEESLRIIVDRTFPLGEASAAHEYLRRGHAVGKVVLVP